MIESVSAVPDAVQIGTKAEVPDPPTNSDAAKVTELSLKVIVVPEPAKNVL